MKNSFALVSAAMLGTALAAPQGGSGSSDSSCSPSYDGEFEIRIIAAVDKRDIKRRQTDDDPQAGAADFSMKLEDGVLTDSDGRTGSIVANNQFQFDKPVQEDAITTSGFSVCEDRYLSLEGDTTFYKCSSGNFANLYNKEIGEHCEAISFTVNPVGGGEDSGSGEDASQIPDGQPQAPTGAAPEGEEPSQIPDGQIQVPTGAAPEGEPASQIPDGQIQVPTGAAPEGEPASQIPDGQIQVPTGAAPEGEPASQIPDGQIQVPTGAAPEGGEPASQIPDGQVQVPTGAAPEEGEPASQIPDGQIQVPTGAAPEEGEPVSQIPDGQPQAPTGEAPSEPTEVAMPPEGEPVSQIPDGQPQAPTGAAPNGTIPETPSGGSEEVEPNAGAKLVPSSIVAVAVGAFGFALAL